LAFCVVKIYTENLVLCQDTNLMQLRHIFSKCWPEFEKFVTFERINWQEKHITPLSSYKPYNRWFHAISGSLFYSTVYFALVHLSAVHFLILTPCLFDSLSFFRSMSKHKIFVFFYNSSKQYTVLFSQVLLLIYIFLQRAVLEIQNNLWGLGTE
jgi:hypothetical protein